MLYWQYLKRTETYGGNYWSPNKGISLGCPLSPLIGALYLSPLDRAMAKLPVFYVRYMDDWVILAKTRHQLRRAIKVMYRILEDLRLRLHPDKTFIGRIQKGFDFLGYHVTLDGLTLANKTITNMRAKISWLYEQGASDARIKAYWSRFCGWARGGLQDVVLPLTEANRPHPGGWGVSVG